MVAATSQSYNNLDNSTGQVLLAAQGTGESVPPGGFSLPDAVGVWVNSLYLSNSSQSAENYNKKAGRFLVRGFRGVSVGLAKGYRFRWLVFTESDEAIAAGLDFGREFHRFVTWLRYYCSDFQYIVVEHKEPRRHWHMITYGSDRLPVNEIRSYWISHYRSTITGLAEIHSVKKAMFYVCGYLKRGGKLARCWCSCGWVWRGWIGFGREYQRRYGEFPSGEVFVELALMDKQRRDYEIEWLKETGELSRLYLDCDGGENGLGTAEY